LLIITHDPALAARCDRVIAMQDGHVVEQAG
jgi:putative ABC transport system ATP-binding protein